VGNEVFDAKLPPGNSVMEPVIPFYVYTSAETEKAEKKSTEKVEADPD